ARLDAVPGAGQLGRELSEGDRYEVRARLAWGEHLCTAGGVLHGGVVMTLGDTAGALCAFLNLPEGALTSTIESKTNFFRGVREGTVEAVARPLHVGRSLIVVHSSLHDCGG